MSRITKALACAVACLGLAACQDNVSDIGSSLVDSEVNITVDSVPTDLHAQSVWEEKFDARTATKLLGNLTVPQYGSLHCSFVSQMMCATKMNIPDTIGVEQVDSARLILSVVRGNLTGDSLAPQQLKVFRILDGKQLPSDTITSRFNPLAGGYYDPSKPFGTKSYTLSNLAKGDSAFRSEPYIRIPVKLPREFARDLFTRYRNNDPMFQWPQTFMKYLPGFYVEQNFGNGCVANITRMETYLYWKHKEMVAYKDERDSIAYRVQDVRDSICLLASQPEVLSSNIINYRASAEIDRMAADGKAVLTSPGGYIVNIRFPLQKLVDTFMSAGTELSVVSALSMEIPARTIKNDYGLTVAPNLLMIRKSERESFFRENKIPDNINSFYAAYDASLGTYRFANMREYFINAVKNAKANSTVGDDEFVLIPVAVSTEDVNNYYSTSTYVTRVAQYIGAPTMTELDADKAIICFTFSSQQLK